MKLGLVINNFESNSGWNSELKYHYRYFKEYGINCNIIHFGLTETDSIIKLPRGLNPLNVIKIYNKLNKNKFDIIHIRGFIGLDFIYVYVALLFLKKIKSIISTVSQVNKTNFSKKLFNENPDINAKKVKYNKNYLKYVTPFFKKFFFLTIGKLILKRSDGLVFYSNYEMKEFSFFYNMCNVKYRILPDFYFSESINQRIINSQAKNNILKDKYDSFTNILYWGRIDVGIKGVNIFVKIAKYLKENMIIHLMGPDYNRSVEKLQKMIKKNKINNVIIHSEKFWRNNINPLLYCDVSITPSEWDGFPRSLRESIYLGVPIICSINSNFDDVINKFDCGYTYNDEKDLIEFLNNYNVEKKQEFKKNIVKAKKYLSEKNCIERYISFYEDILNE